MKNTRTSLAVARTATTNGRRLAILTGFSLTMLLVRAFAYPVPLPAFAVFLAWMAAGILYQIALRSVATAEGADSLQTIGFMVDLTLLTFMYAMVGGGWWMGATLHIVITTAAFSSLPRPRARAVALFAAIAFVAFLATQTGGLGNESSFLGIPPIEGRYAFAVVAGLFGIGALASGGYVQETFVGEMQRSQERYQVILQAAPDMIITTDRDGIIVSANEATYLQSGRLHDEILNRPFTSFVDPSEVPNLMEHVAATLRGESRQFEVQYVAANGVPYWLHCSSNPLIDDLTVTGILIIGHDTTERRLADERIKSHQALLAETQRIAHLGSWEWDMETNFVYWSDELYSIAGIEPGTAVTFESFMEIVHPEDRDHVAATVQRSIETGHPFELDQRLIRPDGSQRSLHSLGNIVPSPDGKPSRLIGTAQDVTERSALTDQLRQAQKMEAVGRLAGGIAHDFNNILTAIKSYSGLLLDDLSPIDPHRADVEEIERAANRAAALTQQLLIFSRHEVVQPRVLNLNESVAQLQSMIGRLIEANIEVTMRLDNSLGMTKADPGQIEQVLMNLVVNARDAMTQGGTIRIETANVELDEDYQRAHQTTTPGSYVMLAVSDTGHGMSRETQGRIFEPFFTTKEIGKGTGLGLSTVYGIVKQSGGHIWVYSEPERGATFKIYLPRVDGLPATAGEERDSWESGANETILLVEDEEAVRDVACRILRRAGYNVLQAGTGAEAVRIYGVDPSSVDLLITDVVMPEVGGWDLANRIREMAPGCRILFMSGYTEDTVLRRSMLQAGSAFIEKPFTPETLSRKVREVLDGAARSRRELQPVA